MFDALSEFASWLIGWIDYGLGYLVGMVLGLLNGLLSIVLLILTKIANVFFDLITTILDASKMSEFVQTVNGGFTGQLGYWADLLQVPQAIIAAFGAYLVRFMIRRIPLIG